MTPSDCAPWFICQGLGSFPGDARLEGQNERPGWLCGALWEGWEAHLRTGQLQEVRGGDLAHSWANSSL